MKTFSILICSIHSRKKLLQRLLDILLKDAGTYEHTRETYSEHFTDYYFFNDIEIIVYTDSMNITIGEKRNRVIKFSTGKYLAFIDDDDTVEPDYIPQIVSKTETDPDCIVFDAIRYVNGVKDKQVKYGVEYRRDFNDKELYYRLPNHLMALRKEIVLAVPYAKVNFGEDSLFARSVSKYIHKQERIDKVLYHYWFSQQQSSTAHLHSQKRLRPVK